MLGSLGSHGRSLHWIWSLVRGILTLFFKHQNHGDLSLKFYKCSLLCFKNSSARNTETLQYYFLADSELTYAESARDLGVIVDNSLKYHMHIRSIVKKSSHLSSNLLKSALCRSPDFMVTILKTYLRPILEYCSWCVELGLC